MSVFFSFFLLHHLRLKTHKRSPSLQPRVQRRDSAERIRFVCVTLFICLFVLPFYILFFHFAFSSFPPATRSNTIPPNFTPPPPNPRWWPPQVFLATLAIFCLVAPNTALCLSAATTSLIYRNAAPATTDNCVAFSARRPRDVSGCLSCRAATGRDAVAAVIRCEVKCGRCEWKGVSGKKSRGGAKC